MPRRASILRDRTAGAGSGEARLRIRAVTAGRSARGWRFAGTAAVAVCTVALSGCGSTPTTAVTTSTRPSAGSTTPTTAGSTVLDASVRLATFAASGHPVVVLGYSGGSWSPLAGLPAPTGQPGADVPPGVLYLAPGQPIAAGDVTGDGQPDFLVLLQAADNTPGFVATDDGGHWHEATFAGPGGSGEVVGRNPQIRGSTLVSVDDNCIPDCAQGQNGTVVWTYQQPPGTFTASTSPA